MKIGKIGNLTNLTNTDSDFTSEKLAVLVRGVRCKHVFVSFGSCVYYILCIYIYLYMYIYIYIYICIYIYIFQWDFPNFPHGIWGIWPTSWPAFSSDPMWSPKEACLEQEQGAHDTETKVDTRRQQPGFSDFVARNTVSHWKPWFSRKKKHYMKNSEIIWNAIGPFSGTCSFHPILLCIFFQVLFPAER